MFQELAELATKLIDATLTDPDTKGHSRMRDQAIKEALFSSPSGSIGDSLAKLSAEFSGEVLCQLKKYKAAKKACMFTYFNTGDEHNKALFLHAQAMILQKAGEHDKSIAKNFTALQLVRKDYIKNLIHAALANSLSAKGITFSTEDETKEKIMEIVRGQTPLIEQDLSKITSMHIAAYSGKADMVKELLKNDTININQQVFDGNTALHLCVAEGHYEVVNLLLQQPNLNIQLTNHDNQTALELSIIKNRLDILELFGDHGIDLKKQDYLDLALEHKSHSTILLFYTLGLNLDLRSDGHKNACSLEYEIEDIYHASPDMYKMMGGIRLLKDLANLPPMISMRVIKFLSVELHKVIGDIHKNFIAGAQDAILTLKKHQKSLPYLIESCKDLLIEDYDDGVRFKNVPGIGLVKSWTIPRNSKSSFKDCEDQKQLLKDITQLLDDLNKFQNQLAEDSLLNDVLEDVFSINIGGEDHTDI